MGRPKTSLVGRRFERLVVKEYYETVKGGDSSWVCVCDCGNETISRGGDLKRGTVRSCGCYRKDHPLNFKFGDSTTRFYRIYQNMIQRCTNEHSISYPYYGGRGIKVCDEWREYANFRKDMLPTYGDNLSIDRINVEGNYELTNCKWATQKEQSLNKRDSLIYTVNGETKPLKTWCEIYNIKYRTVQKRLYRGYDIETSLMAPLNQYGKISRTT